LALIRCGLSWDGASLVASHNDPNPRNILFEALASGWSIGNSASRTTRSWTSRS
jgi:hypothetical protein